MNSAKVRMLCAGGLLAVAVSVIVAGAARGQAPAKAPEKWSVFKFKDVDRSYSVEYPADWHPIKGTSELDLVNYEPETGDFGILFHPEGHFGAPPSEIAMEAELALNAHPPDVQTVDEWMIQELRDEEIDKDEKIPIPKPAANGCLQLRRVLGTNEINGSVFADAYFYCTTKTGLFEILVTYRRGNPRENELRALAMRMALSLRVP